MTVRPLGPEDAEPVAHLLLASIGPAWTAEAVREEITRRGAVALGVLQDGEALGAILGFTVVDELEIDVVAVAPTARRRGLGRSLVEAAMARARSCGAAQAFLEVRAGNAAARALYASLGFAESGVRRGYYDDGEDAIRMARAT